MPRALEGASYDLRSVLQTAAVIEPMAPAIVANSPIHAPWPLM